MAAVLPRGRRGTGRDRPVCGSCQGATGIQLAVKERLVVELQKLVRAHKERRRRRPDLRGNQPRRPSVRCSAGRAAREGHRHAIIERRVDGVEVDATIQHEREILISTVRRPSIVDGRRGAGASLAIDSSSASPFLLISLGIRSTGPRRRPSWLMPPGRLCGILGRLCVGFARAERSRWRRGRLDAIAADCAAFAGMSRPAGRTRARTARRRRRCTRWRPRRRAGARPGPSSPTRKGGIDWPA